MLTHRTPEQIRALDGPELTRLAFELGLGPEGIQAFTVLEDPEKRYWYVEYAMAYWSWEPHTNLAQADTVFRRLRARGWITMVEGIEARGSVQVTPLLVDDPRAARVIDWPSAAPTEAHALLLCAVLAVASEEEAESVCG